MKATLLCFLAPLAVLGAPSVEIGPRQAAASLDALMKAKGKLYFGTCADQGRLSSGKTAAVIQANFGQVTPENSMKWDQTENTRGKFNLGGGDYLVDWATTNNKTIRGHTLVWHSQLAGWVSNIRDKATLTTVIKDHVTTLVTRYKGKIRAWVSWRIITHVVT
jgi:endo-1,4-beta-xylanase